MAKYKEPKYKHSYCVQEHWLKETDSFQKLARFVVAKLFDGLIRGGCKEMEGEFYTIQNYIIDWHYYYVAHEAFPKAKRR